MIKNDNWKEKAESMIERINFNYDRKAKRFLRNRGEEVADWNIDASLIGLVWPFNIIKYDDERIVETVKQI